MFQFRFVRQCWCCRLRGQKSHACACECARMTATRDTDVRVWVSLLRAIGVYFQMLIFIPLKCAHCYAYHELNNDMHSNAFLSQWQTFVCLRCKAARTVHTHTKRINWKWRTKAKASSSSLHCQQQQLSTVSDVRHCVSEWRHYAYHVIITCAFHK